MNLDDLLARTLPQAEVKLGDGTTVRVRGLSRAEAVEMRAITGDQAALETALLATGLVDPPVPAERVEALRKVLTNDEVDDLIAAIHSLSGLGREQAKADYKSDAGGPGSGIRTFPGGEAEHVRDAPES